MNQVYRFFATAPKGIASMLNRELIGLGADWTEQTTSGVFFGGEIRLGYLACLWLRTANRVLMPLNSFEAKNPDILYEGIKQIDWSEHLEPEGSLAVDFFSSRSRIDHTHYGALKVKDAVVDQFRDKFDCRPSVELSRPDIRINVHLFKNQATVSLDLSGESLHKRGYRLEGGTAPMKENLAAAILLSSGWREIAERGGGLIDPMCGSGTLPIEAALIAADSAPGLLRNYFGFLGWKQHDPAIWDILLTEAEEREAKKISLLPPIVGYDADPKAIRNSVANLEKAGLTGFVHFEKKELSDLIPHPKTRGKPGIVILNPPYGERIGKQSKLFSLYRELGVKLRSEFSTWQAALFTGNIQLGQVVGLRPDTTDTFYNGAIECHLLNFQPTGIKADPGKPSAVTEALSIPKNWKAGSEIEAFSNRLKKNLKRLKKWRESENINCFRVYDHDLPEYAVAIDIYHDRVHVQEYQAPATVEIEKARSRLRDILSVLPDILNLPVKNIFLKVRHRQKGNAQYQRLKSEQVFHEVFEGTCRFYVNFDDYLDTGLFLDHRLTRQMIGEMAKGKRFLNLFSYTGTATVHAALGGALSTTSVDSSQTYLDWAKRNLALNQIKADQHRFERSDCITWLRQADREYDLIFLDPPTFSNTHKTKSVFDIQRDHPHLIQHTIDCLTEEGTLIFSNNFRNFKLAQQITETYQVKNISKETLPPDFRRRPNIHHCWMISHKIMS